MPEIGPRLRARKIQETIRALTIIENALGDRLGPIEIPLRMGSVNAADRSATDKLLPPKRVAEVLGISQKTLANWRCSGTQGLPHIKVGSRIFYRSVDVHAFIVSNSKQSTSHIGGNYA